MKKGEIREGIITSYDFPNKGSLIDDDIKVTVKNALPGQRVRYSVQKKRSGSAVGRLIDVIERSPDETAEPFCPNFGVCGSCLYQTYPYEKQLEVKKNQVVKLLDGVCEEYTFDGIYANPSIYGYRNKMEFTFGDEYKGGPLTLGLHKRGSFYDLIDASCCRLVDDDFGKILSTVKDYCAENNLPYYHRMSHEGFLRHLLIRRASKTGEILVDIVTTDTVSHDFAPLVERILGLSLNGIIAGILNTINNNVADTIKDEGTKVLYGKDYFYEELLGLRFKITPFSFFQTNSEGAEVLYKTALDYLSKDLKEKTVYDLYCGTGTISQILAPHVKEVIGVEIVEEAVAAARENAKLNNIDNCKFIAGDVLKTLDSIETLPDVIILDPPRDGVHPRALRKILDYGVNEIIYISCKPTSLARDLVIMQEGGYEVKNVSAVDMFSWTNHVETCCLLERVRNAKDHISFTLDMEDYYRIKDDYGEIVIYQTEDGLTRIEVKMENETIWLTQAQLVELYQSSKSNVSEHITHIFDGDAF